MIEDLRRRIPHEEFDYQTLLDSLRTYSRPRDKITALLKKGVIVRIKKGLYIFGEEYRKNPYSNEILANLICGPSYISLEYALQYYGLIPERVVAGDIGNNRTVKRISHSCGPVYLSNDSKEGFPDRDGPGRNRCWSIVFNRSS